MSDYDGTDNRNHYKGSHHESNVADRIFNQDNPKTDDTPHQGADRNHNGQPDLPREEQRIAMKFRTAPTMAAAILATLLFLNPGGTVNAADDTQDRTDDIVFNVYKSVQYSTFSFSADRVNAFAGQDDKYFGNQNQGVEQVSFFADTYVDADGRFFDNYDRGSVDNQLDGAFSVYGDYDDADFDVDVDGIVSDYEAYQDAEIDNPIFDGKAGYDRGEDFNVRPSTMR